MVSVTSVVKGSWGLLRMPLVSVLALMLFALPAAAQRAVVFPLDQTSGPPTAGWLGMGLAVALNDALVVSGAPTIPAEDLTAYYEQEGLVSQPRFSAAAQVALARQLGAGTAVRGTYAVEGDTVTVEVEALAVGGDLKRLGRWSEKAPLADLSGLLKRLRDGLLSAMGLQPGAGVPRKPEAIEAYIRGRIAEEPLLKEVYFRKAAELEPEWDDARCYLAVALAEEDRTTEAKELLEVLRGRTYPRASLGLVTLGLLRMDEGAVGDARKLFLESLRRGENPDAHLGMARLALLLGHPEEAARELRVAESFGTHQEAIDAVREELRNTKPAPPPPPPVAPPAAPAQPVPPAPETPPPPAETPGGGS